jgi:hypothetical protein
VNSVMNLLVPLNARNLPSCYTTCGLSSGTQLHIVIYLVSYNKQYQLDDLKMMR